MIAIPILARRARQPRPLCSAPECFNQCSAPDHAYCSVECSNGSRGFLLNRDELRFHFYRLGSRKAVAQLYGVSFHTVFRQLPTDHTDRMLRGEMVQIGRVLAKRCVGCGVTWPLDRYWVATSLSGCGGHCEHCRAKAKSLAPRGT